MIKYSSRERCVSLSHIVDTLFLSNFRLALIISSVAAVFTILMMVLDHLILSEPFFSNSYLHSSFYSSLSGVIGMLLAFRTSQAYGRFWDATNLTFELFGDLFLSVSNLIAFCLYSEATRAQITTFQQTLVRLMSLLSAMMLTELEGYDTLNEAPYEVIELESFERHSMSSLMTEKDKTEIVFQWIKNLMVESITGGVGVKPRRLSSLSRSHRRGAILCMFHGSKVSVNNWNLRHMFAPLAFFFSCHFGLARYRLKITMLAV